MATKQTGMTVETAAQLPTTRALISQEVSRALTELAEDSENDDENEVELTPADRIVAMLQSDLGDRAYVRVYRFDDRTGQRTFCKDYTPSEFESNGYELVRNDWGPGKYAVVIYGNQPGSKLFGIRGREELLFANPIRAAVVPTAAPPQNDMMAQILMKITEGQERIIQALATPQNQKSAREELKETLELMALMRPPETPKSSIGEIVEAIKEMKGVSDLIGGGGKDEPSMMSMASEVLAVVKPMIEQRAQQQPPQLPVAPFPQLAIPSSLNMAPAEPRENPINDNPSLNNQIDLDDPDMLEFLSFVAQLRKNVLPHAGDDSKIAQVAELLADKAPEDLLDLFEPDTWLDAFKQLAPMQPVLAPLLMPLLNDHAPWLTKVRDHLLTLLKDED